MSENESRSLGESPHRAQTTGPTEQGISEAVDAPIASQASAPGMRVGDRPAEPEPAAEPVVDPMAVFDDRGLLQAAEARVASPPHEPAVLVDPAAPFDDRPAAPPSQPVASIGEPSLSDAVSDEASAGPVVPAEQVEEPSPATADEAGFPGISLMLGERVELALNLSEHEAKGNRGGRDIVLLTNKRLIRLAVESRRRIVTFVSIGDVDSAETRTERGGFSGYFWGALAFFVALMLRLVWEQPVGSVAGPVVVAAMGVYLIVEQFLAPAAVAVTFTAGSSELKCGLTDDVPSAEVSSFINRLFELKGQ